MNIAKTKTRPTTYQVNELFVSPQGEGYWTGRMATFIRLQGCTVGCPWCDSGPLADLQKGRQTNGMTRNTWGKGGERMTLEEILGQVTTHHVIITGGEPTLYDLDPILMRLHRHYTQIETSGQNDLKGQIEPDWITWSPKQNLAWDAPYELKLLTREVKWVVDEPLQWEKILETWQWYVDNVHPDQIPWFYFMPEGCPPRPEMIAKTLEWLNGPSQRVQGMGSKVRFGDRLQYRIGVR